MREPGPERLEHDSLGSVSLPATALYGVHTVRPLQNLSFSTCVLGSCIPYVSTLGAVKHAAARANQEAGILEPPLATAIETAASALQRGEHLDHLRVDLLGGGGAIAVHMNVNEVVANLANETLGGRRGHYAPVTIKTVSASQSTADVCHTASRLALVRQWQALEPLMRALVQVLKEQQQVLEPIRTLARTCLRDALPVSLAVLFGGYATLCARRREELDRAVMPLRTVVLGGTVIGTGEGAPSRCRERVVPILAEIVDLPLTARDNAADALQNSDDLATLSTQVRLFAEALMKIGQDLRLLASGPRGGFGELVLPPAQEGSSFFSGKYNPVIPETVMQCGFQVLGCDRAVQAAAERAELYLNVFDGAVAINILNAMEMLANVLPSFTDRCLRGLRADEARCRALAALGEG